MKVLIVGGGGREHALAWKAARSPKVQQVFVAPGNAGTAHESKTQNIGADAEDIEELIRTARRLEVDLTIVGPEAPLAAGIVDRFTEARLRCFGPGRAAARLESSKTFAKDFLARHGIPTAAYGSFTEPGAAAAYIRKIAAPIVIKADGLAAGKGVVIAQTQTEAIDAINGMLTGTVLGEAGRRVVVEEFLEGEEASFIVLVDGAHVLPLATSQDHKRIGDGDTGPNTGGMGAYSPAPVVDKTVHDKIMREVILPTVSAMRAEGHPYVGFLYAGLMIEKDGAPRVLEFNCRFGDPETQPILMRLQSDLIELIESALAGRLDRTQCRWDPRCALGVVMAAGGYPGKYEKGRTISGLPQDASDVKIFHAGTVEREGKIVTNGGRVLCVTALGHTVAAAQRRAYEVVDQIRWSGACYRHDIGFRAIAREQI